MVRRRSQEDVESIIESYGCKLLDKYKTRKQKMKIQCKCGEEFYDSLENILYNKYCNCEKCNLIRKSQKSYDEFIEDLNNHNYKYKSNREDFINSMSLVKVECDHNHVFTTSKNRLQQGHVCPTCWEKGILTQERTYRKPYEEIKSEIEENGDKLLTPKENYTGTKCEIIIEGNCGHTYTTTYNTYHAGHRCPFCKNYKGENKIESVLIDNNIVFEREKKFDECKHKYRLRFDFYLPDYNMCIEYDGLQHFKPVDFSGNGYEWALNRFIESNIKDTIKNIYCQQNNIKLIRIPYWDINNIEEILKKELNL